MSALAPATLAPWSPMSRMSPVSEVPLVIVTVSSCLKRKSLHKCFCIFCKGQAQDYNLGAKTFNSVNIFMVSKRSCKFFIAPQSQAFSKFSPALINTIRVFLSRRGLTGLMSPGPVWTTLMLLRRERESKLGVITLTASRARTLATWTPQVIKKGLPDIYCRH